MHQKHTTTRWPKADGTDIQVGLHESITNDRSGDVRTVKQRRCLATIGGDLQKLLDKMPEEKLFLTEGLTKAKHPYESKRRALNVLENSLFVLAWNVEGYYKLVEKNETIQITIRGILQRISGPPNE